MLVKESKGSRGAEELISLLETEQEDYLKKLGRILREGDAVSKFIIWFAGDRVNPYCLFGHSVGKDVLSLISLASKLSHSLYDDGEVSLVVDKDSREPHVIFRDFSHMSEVEIDGLINEDLCVTGTPRSYSVIGGEGISKVYDLYDAYEAAREVRSKRIEDYLAGIVTDVRGENL